MSVLVPDLKIFQYVEMGFYVAVNRSVIDDLYCSSLREHCLNKDAEREGTRWVKNILLLNCKSYSARYGEKLDDYHKFYKSPMSDRKLIPVMSFQLLKYLECIAYQIEMTTIPNGRDNVSFVISEQDQKDFDLLLSFIADLRQAIVSQIPIYQNAKWAEI